MPKRKSITTLAQGATPDSNPLPVGLPIDLPPSKRRAKGAYNGGAIASVTSTNPNKNADVLDGPEALRASPDADGKDEQLNVARAGMNVEKQVKQEDDSGNATLAVKPKSKKEVKKTKDDPSNPAVENGASAATPATKTENKKSPAKETQFLDPEADEDDEADEEEIKAALSRPPPVHSDYLPLPWKGRLGYACLNTYLRFSNPPVFSSRTCRIASILENRHPLTDPNEPPHATKNRPDRTKPADIGRGQAFVESLGKANARDIVKMLRWNERYGIKFMRLSSEMFPFASHEEYGYKLAPFVSEELAAAGKVAAEFGHRLTTHPGQYTQLGSPRKSVIENAIRDLEYHAELLSLLKLPPQQDRDAVMILHLGGVFGDRAATLDRFRENYAKLSPEVKKRLVLENDDVCWCVHELLPLCEELNIPMVLDFHHHNIVFDAEQIREGSKGIVDLYPRILATWKRKNITPKMHYSEPTPAAITPKQRRKHNPRVASLPPCPPDMDLMIEAKDKEQAVFELMRIFKLPGFDTFNDMLPHTRRDDNKPIRTPKKKSKKDASVEPEPEPETIADDEVGMGGPEGRVYWPPGMEEWLRPVKRVVKPKEENEAGEKKLTPAQKKKAAAAEAATKEAIKVEEEVQAEAATPTPAGKKGRGKTKSAPPPPAPAAAVQPTKAKDKKVPAAINKRKSAKDVPTPSTSDEDDELSELSEEDESEEDLPPPKTNKRAKPLAATKVAAATSGRQSGRAKRISYTEADD